MYDFNNHRESYGLVICGFVISVHNEGLILKWGAIRNLGTIIILYTCFSEPIGNFHNIRIAFVSECSSLVITNEIILFR